MLDAVFAKAIPTSVDGSGKDEVRQDKCGASIRRGSHGETTDQGWEVDHIQPVSDGGADDLSNLQPLQWANNREKDDGPNHGFCVKP